MSIDTTQSPASTVASPLAPPTALQRVVATGLLRCAVPTSCGGNGGSLGSGAVVNQGLLRFNRADDVELLGVVEDEDADPHGP